MAEQEVQVNVLSLCVRVCVKAPLRVMYRKYSMKGGVEWQIQHEAKPSAILARDPTPNTVFSIATSRVNDTLTDCFVLGGLADGFG